MEDDRKNVLDNKHLVANDAGNILNREGNILNKEGNILNKEGNILNREGNVMNNGGICNEGGLNATLVGAGCGNGTESVKWCVSGPGVQNLPSSSLPPNLRFRYKRKLPELVSNQQDLIAESNPEAEHLSISTFVGNMLMKAERKRHAESLFDCETKTKTMKIELAPENVGQKRKKSKTTVLEHKQTENLIKKLGIKKVISTIKDKTNRKKLKGSTITKIGNGKDKILKQQTTRTKMLEGMAKTGNEVAREAGEAEKGVKKQPAKAKKVVKKNTTEDGIRVKKRPTEAKSVVKKSTTTDKSRMIKPEKAIKKNTMDAKKARKKKPEKLVTNEANEVEKTFKKRPVKAEKLHKESIMKANEGIEKKTARAENVKKSTKSENAHKVPSEAKRTVKKSTMDAEIALKKKPEKVVTKEVEKSSKKRPEKAGKVGHIMVPEAEKEVKKKKLATANKEGVGKATEDETGANKHPAKTATMIKKTVSEAERLVKKKVLSAENLRRKKAYKAETEVKKGEKTENVRKTQVAEAKNMVKKKAAKTEKGVRNRATEAEKVENKALAKMENVVEKKSATVEAVPEAKKKALKSEKVVERKAVKGGTGVKGKEVETKTVVKKRATVTEGRRSETEKYILINREETENERGVKRKATEVEEVLNRKAKRTNTKFKRSLPKSLNEVVRQNKCKMLEVRLTAVKKLGRRSAAEVGTLKTKTEMEVSKTSKVSLHRLKDAIFTSLDSRSLQRDDSSKNSLQMQEVDPFPVLSEIKSVALENSLLEGQDVSQIVDKLKMKVFDCTVLNQKIIDPMASVLVEETLETLIPEPTDESLQNPQRDVLGRRVIGTVSILLPTDKSRSTCLNFGGSISVENQVIVYGSSVCEANSQLKDSLIKTEAHEIEVEMNPEYSKQLADKEVCAHVQQKTEPRLFLNEAAECVEETNKPDVMSNMVWHSSGGKQIKISSINTSIPAGETALSAENTYTCSITMEPLSENGKNSDDLATIPSVRAGRPFCVVQQTSQPKKVLQPWKHARLDDIAGKLWKMKLRAVGHADLSEKTEEVTEIQNQCDAIASELNTVVDKSMRDVSVFSEHSYARKQSTGGETTIPKNERYKMMQAADVLLKPIGSSKESTISHSGSLTSKEHLNADEDSKRVTTLAVDYLNPTTSVESISCLPEDHVNTVIPSHAVETVTEKHTNAVVSFRNVTASPEMQFNATKHTQSFSGISEKQLLTVTDYHSSKEMSQEQLNAFMDFQNVTAMTEKQLKPVAPAKNITAMSENQLNDGIHSQNVTAMSEKQLHVISCSKKITDLQEKQLKAVTLSQNVKAVSGKLLNAVSFSQSAKVIPEHLTIAAHSQSVTAKSEEEINVIAHSQSFTAMPKEQLQVVAPTESVMVMPKEYMLGFIQPSGLMLIPGENYSAEQQVCDNPVPDGGVSANLDVYDVAQSQGITLTTPGEYYKTFAPHPGFAVVLQGGNCNCLRKEMCCSNAQSQVWNSKMLQLQNDTILPGQLCYAVVQSQVGNTNLLQLWNDTPKQVCYNVSQQGNNNLLQLQNDTFLPHKVCYAVAPSQVGNSNLLPLQNDTFLPEQVYYFVESSEDKREMAKDENVNRLQSQNDAFLSEEVRYLVESSEDKGEMANDENVNRLQSQNDAFLSEEVCYLVESSEDEREKAEGENVNGLQLQNDAFFVESSEDKREMANEYVNLLPLQSDTFLPEEVCCITPEFNADFVMSQDNCYTFMPTLKTEVPSIKFDVMPEKDSFCIVGQSEDVIKASEGYFEQLRSDEHILNCGKDIILDSQDLNEGCAKTKPVSDPYTGNKNFSAVKEVDAFSVTVPQSTINLPEVASFATVKRKKNESAVFSNFVDVQEVNCSMALSSEGLLNMLDIGCCVDVQSVSAKIMPQYLTDDGAVTLTKKGFVDEPGHNPTPEESKRKLPKRQCKTVATAKENSKNDAQKIRRGSILGLRVNPAKVKPFQFDHQGVAVKTEEKACETSKDSGDIMSKLLQSLVKSNKKTTDPKKQLVEQPESDLAESVSRRLGELVWARLSFQRFWPAIVVDPLTCGQSTTKPGYCWVFWFGDYKVSEVPLAKVLPFASNFSAKYVKSQRKTYETGILEAVKELADRVHGTDCEGVKSSKDLIAWVRNSFSKTSEVHKECSLRLPNWILEKLEKIRLVQLELQDSDTEANVCRKDESKAINATSEFCKDGQEIQSITDVCIVCCCVLIGSKRYEHPFFTGGLCPSCREAILQSIFFFDSDGTNSYCIICGFGKEVFVCEVVGCNKVYCSDCIRRLAGEGTVEAVRKKDEWSCFLCTTYDPKKHGLLKGKREWRTNLASLFQPSGIDPNKAVADRQPIRVLSLFDGIGTGKLVLDQLNIQIEKYFASEVEQDAITVSQIRHPGLIHHLGDVRSVKRETLNEIGPIDLLIGGSPCNELSVANPCRKGLEAGSGLLFFDFCRILWSLKTENKNRPLFWIYENVASMNDESRSIISRMLECESALWDAKYFSAQRRARYFWGNIPGMYCPLQYSATEAGGSLEDSLFPTRKAKVQKVRTITTQRNSLLMDRNKEDSFPVTMGDADDSLWIPEVERIFGFPEHYTDVANLSASRRLKLLGQSWSVPVIRHLLSPLCNYFQVTSNAAETLSGAAVANYSGAKVTTAMSASNASTSSSTNAVSDRN